MRAMLRSGLVTAAAILLLCSATPAQNGTSYHILTIDGIRGRDTIGQE